MPSDDSQPDVTASNRTTRGIKQRNRVRMSEDEVDGFLRGRHSMTVCTFNHDGTIHAVAMWYGFLEGAVALETKTKSQKALNLRRDSRMTLLVEDGEQYMTLRGVELVGRAEIVEEPERMWELGVSVFDRYQAPYSEEHRAAVQSMLNNRIVVKMHVDRVVSWDHRKLG